MMYVDLAVLDEPVLLCYWCGYGIRPLDNIRETAPTFSRISELVHARCEKPYWAFIGNV